MKEYDIVELLIDRPQYQKEGVKKGMFGVIMSEQKLCGKWQVIFSKFGSGKDIADLGIFEEDLQVVPCVPHEKLIPEQIG